MVNDLLTGLAWVSVAAAFVGAASWWAHRSYRRFLHKARGPAATALPLEGPKTPLDNLISPREQKNPGQTGLTLLLDNTDAFAARKQAADRAGRSLDLMYYIWRTDISGWLLIDALVAAADRGVRIRLLLDDVNVQGFDRTFLALTQHPRIEVRLFNPLRNRGFVLRRMVEMALGLARFNRRMHGKMWIADGRLAIIGGRNIGDTYFGVDDSNRNSVDADLAFVGPKVADLSAIFDGYWNLGLSLPIAALWPAFKANRAAFRSRLARQMASAATISFKQKLQKADMTGSFLADRLHWTDKAQLLADPPDKAYGKHTAPWMDTAIANILTTVKREVQLVTPYFVPGTAGMIGLTDLLARGVKVSLITNALSATDHITVFGAYRYYRRPLLAAGAAIFEFSKPAPEGQKRDVVHSKVFVIDGKRALLGSVNFDLRSAYINTELGMLVEQPDLVGELTAMFAALSAPDQAYRVTFHDHILCWALARAGLPTEMTVEPEAGRSRRAISWIVGQLPIQRYL